MELDRRYRWYKVRLKDVAHNPVWYTFRGVTANELRIAGTKVSKFDAETFLLTTCVQSPLVDWTSMLAGVCTKLLIEIYRVSGIDEAGATFSEAMDWITSQTGALEAAAVAMLPGVTLELLHNCDPSNYAKYLIMGKFQWETITGIPVEQAFIGGQPQGGPNVQVQKADRAHLKKGDVGYDVKQFSWHAGQGPLDVPLDRIDEFDR